MRTKFHVESWAWAALFALAGLPSVASAQGSALSVGNWIPVTNALWRNLPGTDGDPDNSGRVEIRQTWTGGTILSPANEQSQIETFNPLVTNSHLGRGVLGINPGTYAETFADRSVLATNLLYYARVFDRADPAAAIYYADTETFPGQPVDVTSINPEFGPLKLVATGELDGDADGDGIPDAMEGDMGLDANSPDHDGDGYGDWFEAHYGDYLDPKEWNSPLEILLNSPENAGVDPHTVSWWTIPVPDMTYRLDYRPLWVDGEAYTNLWSGAATDTHLEVDVEDWVQADGVKGFFRVTVPYEGP
ncbi:MAG: hypothetical protein AB7V14_05525 [Kiritimatiellia bacterium]